MSKRTTKAPKAPKAPKGKKATKATTKVAATKVAVAKAKPEGPAPAREGSKLALIISMMQAKGGTTLADMAMATKWAPAAVSGVIYNAVKGRLGLTVTLTPHDDGTVFTIANGKSAQPASTGK